MAYKRLEDIIDVIRESVDVIDGYYSHFPKYGIFHIKRFRLFQNAKKARKNLTFLAFFITINIFM